MTTIDRRALVLGGGLALAGGWACRGRGRGDPTGDPRLPVGAAGAPGSALPVGTSRLGQGDARDGALFVPAGPARGLLVVLHGRTGRGERTLRHWQPAAERHGWVVLAPDARGETWDAIERRRFGVDVAFLGEAIAAVRARAAGPLDRLVLAGFSDGASYALTLGLANGDRFGAIVAMSPGGTYPVARRGRPRVFIGHGRSDHVLPFAECGEAIAGELTRDGYPVTLAPFDGGHHLDPATIERALTWLDAPA